MLSISIALRSHGCHWSLGYADSNERRSFTIKTTFTVCGVMLAFCLGWALATGPRHHYTFQLFALDTKLDLGPDTPRADVIKALNGHILGKAVYVGLLHLPSL